MSEMTAKEMFEALGYEQTINSGYLIKYTNHGLGDGDYKSVSFDRMWNEYEVYETTTLIASRVSIKEHEAITKQMKELGWI